MGLWMFSKNALKNPSDSSSSLKRKNTHAIVTKANVQNELRNTPKALEPKRYGLGCLVWFMGESLESLGLESLDCVGVFFDLAVDLDLVEVLRDFSCCGRFGVVFL